MSRVVIVADDLTGANAAGVLLARHGFKAATFLNPAKYNVEEILDFDIITISTDSRAIQKEQAYSRVKSVIEFFKNKEIRLFSKRIDSTLRGNIGTEITAMLDTLESDAYAIVVPSFPASGRICVGGYLMVNQVPLEKTDAAKDHITPVQTSKAVDLFEGQIRQKLGFVELDKVIKGAGSIEKAIIGEINGRNKIIVVDASTNEDIYEIAKAVKNLGINAIAVDPGPFTAYLAREYLKIPRSEPKPKVMLAVGSVSNLSRKQLDVLKSECLSFITEVDTLKLIHEATREEEINLSVNKLLKEIDKYDVIGISTSCTKNDILNIRDIANELKITEDEVSQSISDGIAAITEAVLKKSDSMIGALFTSGGDVTVAVCKALGSSGIEIKDEVLPLAVYGRIMKGSYDNMHIVTKGGLIGDDKAILKCVEYLLRRISNGYHN